MGNTLNWSYETTLPAEPLSASMARAFVCEHLVQHKLTHLIDSVQLVASELAANVVLHASTAFTVTLSGGDAGVRLAVRDHSPFEPVRVAAHVMDTRGRGLLMVDAVSQAWGVTLDRHGWKTVWATFAEDQVPPSRVNARRGVRRGSANQAG